MNKEKIYYLYLYDSETKKSGVLKFKDFYTAHLIANLHKVRKYSIWGKIYLEEQIDGEKKYTLCWEGY